MRLLAQFVGILLLIGFVGPSPATSRLSSSSAVEDERREFASLLAVHAPFLADVHVKHE